MCAADGNQKQNTQFLYALESEIHNNQVKKFLIRETLKLSMCARSSLKKNSKKISCVMCHVSCVMCHLSPVTNI